jgi:hypothetical protein
MKAYWGSGGIAPWIIYLCTRRRWVVSFTPRPLYPRRKTARYPLHRRLGEPRSRSGHGGKEKNSQPPSGIEHLNPRPSWYTILVGWCIRRSPGNETAVYIVWNITVNLSLCFFFNWAPRHEGALGSGCIAPRILDFGTTRRWVVSFVPRPLYPRGKIAPYPLDRRLGGPQSRSGHGGEEKNS